MAQLEGQTLADNSGESEFVQCLKSNGVSTDSIKKLTASGLNTLDLLRSMEDDFDEVIQACGINIIDKVKLRNVIRSLAQVIVDTKETSAILDMQKKLQSIKNAIDMVANTKQNIDDQVATYTKTIKSTFGKFHQLLNQREAKLIESLNSIASEKKRKLESISKNITKQSVDAEQKTNLCRKRLKKSIELEQIEARKKEILQVAGEVNNIKIVTKNDAVISDNKINVILDEVVIIKAINTFGDVSAGVTPVIISLSDTGHCGVKINWKLNGVVEEKNNINDKIKIEWREMEEKDDEHDEKKNWHNKDIEVHSLENVNELIIENVKIDSATADFAFKMRYYKNKWSNYSNIMTVKLKLSFDLTGLNSVMIKGNVLQTLFFTKVLPDSLKNKTYSLLLRGSEHGFDVAAFKSRCVNKGHLLMVVSSKEYDRIFGGYTSTGWDKTNGYKADANAFMYFMSENQNQAYRFPVKNKDGTNAIYNTTSYIGCFGGAGDLGWNPNGSSYCNRNVFDYSILGNDETPLAGGQNNWHVKDYEIWKMT